jgi:predicted RNA polymerase sigma factor
VVARDVNADTKLDLIDQAAVHAEGWVLGMVEVSRALLLAERDGAEAALAELDDVEERHRRRGNVCTCIEHVRRTIAADAAVAR